MKNSTTSKAVMLNEGKYLIEKTYQNFNKTINNQQNRKANKNEKHLKD